MRHWLICYDIEDDKQRAKLYRCLFRYGIPVQRSVFEVSFPDDGKTDEQTMFAEINQIVEVGDNVVFYRQTKNSLDQSFSLDERILFEQNDFYII